MKKKYTIYAHAIHSRIQMIRDKILYEKGMTARDLVVRNKKYFELAIDSVMKQHDLTHPHIDDTFDAATMFLISIGIDPVLEHSVDDSGPFRVWTPEGIMIEHPDGSRSPEK